MLRACERAESGARYDGESDGRKSPSDIDRAGIAGAAPGAAVAGIVAAAAVGAEIVAACHEGPAALDHGVDPVGDVDRPDGLYQELVDARR